MMYHGCEQSRKLLAHYRRCRTLRSRLATGSHSNANNNNTKPQFTSANLSHHCLVCSLVARQARTMLEQRTAPPPNTTTNGMNVFKASSTNVKRNLSSSSATTRQKMTSYTVLSTSANEIHLLNGRNGYTGSRNSEDSPALKMPPPPPRTMNPMTNAQNNDGNNGSNFNDALARLYATAKQLDTVAPHLDRPLNNQNNNNVNDHEHTFPEEGNDVAYPVVVRRERSFSDTDLLCNFKSTSSVPVVDTNNYTTTMTMITEDDDDQDVDDMDEIIHVGTDSSMAGTSSGMLLHPKQRNRSASCGSGAIISNNDVTTTGLVSLSPSNHHYCETIVEEEL